MQQRRTMRLCWVLGTPLLLSFLACGDDGPGPVSPDPDPDPPTVPAEVSMWLNQEVSPFAGTDLSLAHDDLAFLADIVGDARIVSLGENTHGTRDFFEMKARILRYLVEEMGFEAFAIEATWPEANRLDRYVRTGEGDPAVLLSGLYFWTWNTESVLEMIEWIRAYNEAGGDVGFYGFDMQFPGMALHNVREFMELVDPARRGEVNVLLDCLEAYANGPDGSFPTVRYEDLTAPDRLRCENSLNEARDLLLEHRAEYEAASSPGEFDTALQSVRVATQYHLMINGDQSRDQSMAENTVWLTDQLGPDSKWVLWAHNFHVSSQPGAQGSFLRSAFGDDMVIFGFSHAEGDFTAVTQSGSSFVGLSAHTLDSPRSSSYELYLGAADAPRFMLDLRDLDTSLTGSTWLSASRQWRTIGCCYEPSAPGRYWADVPLRDWFDVVIHFDQTGRTTLLPFQFPTSF